MHGRKTVRLNLLMTFLLKIKLKVRLEHLVLKMITQDLDIYKVENKKFIKF